MQLLLLYQMIYMHKCAADGNDFKIIYVPFYLVLESFLSDPMKTADFRIKHQIQNIEPRADQ